MKSGETYIKIFGLRVLIELHKNTLNGEVSTSNEGYNETFD